MLKLSKIYKSTIDLKLLQDFVLVIATGTKYEYNYSIKRFTDTEDETSIAFNNTNFGLTSEVCTLRYFV